jgi:predicted ATPase
MRYVRRIALAADAPASGYPWEIPAVAALRNGLDLPDGVTFLVGENGSGKSTLVEGLALALGFNAEGGTRSLRHRTYESESPLAGHLVVERSPGKPRNGFFLRAETMHGVFTEVETMPFADLRPYGGASLHARSHGESFLQVVRHRFAGQGLYLMDEPEAALSFRSSLGLVAVLHDLAANGSQVVVATHSPLLASVPGATILELGDHGVRRAEWASLDLVDSWRRYLAAPESYLRHLLEP